ncbi:MAG: DUF302 domain-containing protein, partial [Chloroflexi bacterium]
MKLIIKVPLLSFFFCLLLLGCSQSEQQHIFQKYSAEDFENTLLNLDISISEHNYRIIHRSTIGQAIRDRGELDFPLSTITEFCNITYAREMMVINPDLINDMPCHIAVRETEQGILVSTKLMDENSNNPDQVQF